MAGAFNKEMEGNMMSETSRPAAASWTRRAISSVSGLPERIRLAIEGGRERSLLRREFDELAQSGELERTLVDSGIARCDVPRLMRAHPHTPEQMADMMTRLGIDRTALARRSAMAEKLRAMEWQCAECTDWRKCRSWLASGDAPESYRAFCPNAKALDELRCAQTAVAGGGVLAELAARDDGGRG